MQVLLDAGGLYLVGCIEPEQIEVKKCEPPAGVHIDDRKGGRVDASLKSETLSQALDQLCFARAERTGEGDDKASLGGLTPGAAEGFGFSGTVRDNDQGRVMSCEWSVIGDQ